MEKQEDAKQKQLDRIEELSKDIFNKPSEEIKYVYATNYIHQQILDEENVRSGLYQWQNVFNGTAKYPRDIRDYNEYDIIQVNASAQDLHLVNEIRRNLKPDSKTRIVLNNDYTTEMWGPSFDYTPVVYESIKDADMLYGTEYFQTTALSEISGRKCYIIPHPSDIRRLKNLPIIPKKNIISTIWRRYDMHGYIPSLVARNHGLITQLIGYDKTKDRKVWVTTTLYDYVFQGTNHFQFTDWMRESRIVYNPFTFHSYDRSTVECAAMGVAVVGSDRTDSCRRLYPFTSCDPYDVKKGRDLITKLLNDEEFNKKVVDYAKINSEFYNITNSKQRYLEALYDSINRKDEKKEKQQVKKEIEEMDKPDVKFDMAKDLNIKEEELKVK